MPRKALSFISFVHYSDNHSNLFERRSNHENKYVKNRNLDNGVNSYCYLFPKKEYHVAKYGVEVRDIIK